LGIFGGGKSGTATKCGTCGHKMVDVSGKPPMERMEMNIHTGYKCAQCEQSYCDCRDLIMLTCKCGARSWMTVAYVS
jgi:uncharacterized protein with PIN domain